MIHTPKISKIKDWITEIKAKRKIEEDIENLTGKTETFENLLKPIYRGICTVGLFEVFNRRYFFYQCI